MPRQPRIEYEGAIYHVMNRGDRREAIAERDDDRKLFIGTLGEACVKTGWQLNPSERVVPASRDGVTPSVLRCGETAARACQRHDHRGGLPMSRQQV